MPHPALMPMIRRNSSDDHAHQTNPMIIQKHIACLGSSHSHLELHEEGAPCLAILVEIRHETVSSDALVADRQRFALYKYFGSYSIMPARTWSRLMQLSGDNEENHPRQDVPRSIKANKEAAFCLHTASPKNNNPTTLLKARRVSGHLVVVSRALEIARSARSVHQTTLGMKFENRHRFSNFGLLFSRF